MKVRQCRRTHGVFMKTAQLQRTLDHNPHAHTTRTNPPQLHGLAPIYSQPARRPVAMTDKDDVKKPDFIEVDIDETNVFAPDTVALIEEYFAAYDELTPSQRKTFDEVYYKKWLREGPESFNAERVKLTPGVSLRNIGSIQGIRVSIRGRSRLSVLRRLRNGGSWLLL